ncbi:MAG: hypothetical protein ACR2MX_01650 [Cyclobacteriaceae bacterium]
MTKRFDPPTHQEAVNHLIEKGFCGDCSTEADKFICFYESKDWYVGKNKMKKWKAALSGWILRGNQHRQHPHEKTLMNDLQDTSWAKHLVGENNEQ